MRRVVVLLVAIHLACVMQTPQQEQDLRMRVPGSYVAVGPDGEQFRLVLGADGSGSLNGHPGTWQIQFGRIVLSDGENLVAADLVGDNLSVYLPEGQVVFVREGSQGAAVAGNAAPGVGAPGHGAPGHGGGPASPARPAREFAPENTLAGDVVTPQGSGAEFTVPDGWSHGWQKNPDGSESYGIQSRKGGTDGTIALTRRLLSGGEQQVPVSQLLEQAVRELAGNTPYDVVVPAEDLLIVGQRAGRIVVRSNPGSGPLELYLAGVVVEHYGFVIAGIYQAGSADRMRPVVDTVLSTFRGSIPPENPQLRARLVGCWENNEFSGGGTGTGSSTTRISIAADGTYQYRHFTSIQVEGMGGTRDNRDAGRYRVEGTTIVATSSQDGSVTSYDASFQGGMLYLNGVRYLPCS
jgi:hypothetical protein